MGYMRTGQTEYKIHEHPTDPAAREAERRAAIASREAMRGRTKVRVATEAQMRAAAEKSAAFRAAREGGVVEPAAEPAAGGSPMTKWILIGGAVIAGVLILRKLRRRGK